MTTIRNEEAAREATLIAQNVKCFNLDSATDKIAAYKAAALAAYLVLVGEESGDPMTAATTAYIAN